MAKSLRSKVKRSFRANKRQDSVYAATAAARLDRLHAKLSAVVSADVERDDEDEMEMEQDGDALLASVRRFLESASRSQTNPAPQGEFCFMIRNGSLTNVFSLCSVRCPSSNQLDASRWDDSRVQQNINTWSTRLAPRRMATFERTRRTPTTCKGVEPTGRSRCP
uniref:DUF2423 domain-containing protein n=1 Tax=Mycena chlorophos TaxID=658473 RepID=A0ABQ0LS40_MYCCL|nr:predicted protein [Mycena chlorophos]